MLSVLLLFLVGPQRTAIPAASPSSVEQPARVELLEGRASLAGAAGVTELSPGERGLTVDGQAYLELRPRSRVALRWNATASMVVHGPAVLEWGPVEGRRTLFEWRFAELDEVHLEVRRGPVRLAFPGGWAGSLESGAGFVRGLPGGGVEWHHDAGLPILLSAPHEPGEVRPPWVVLAGAWLRLHPGAAYPEVLPGSASRLLDPYARQGVGPRDPHAQPPWGGFDWPWEEPALLAEAPPPAEAGSAPQRSLVQEPRPVPDGVFLPVAPVGVQVPPTAGPRVEVPPESGQAPQPDPPGQGLAPSQPPGQDEAGSAQVQFRPVPGGGVLRLTPWGVRRYRRP